MGKTLRPEHIEFFTNRMDEHSLVSNWIPISNQHDYLFKVTRTRSGHMTDVIVHLTDAYRYGLAEFFARPGQLRAGSYVVIAMPHAYTDLEVIETAQEHQIGVGHIGKFMGALNSGNVWEYLTQDEKREQSRRDQAQKERDGTQGE